MSKWNRFLDHPLLVYLIIGSFSVISAYIFWSIGDSFAKVVSDKPVVGVTFEAGGALAGFILVFWLSISIIERLHKLSPEPSPIFRRIKVFLIPRSLSNRGFNDQPSGVRISIGNKSDWPISSIGSLADSDARLVPLMPIRWYPKHSFKLTRTGNPT